MVRPKLGAFTRHRATYNPSHAGDELDRLLHFEPRTHFGGLSFLLELKYYPLFLPLHMYIDSEKANIRGGVWK